MFLSHFKHTHTHTHTQQIKAPEKELSSKEIANLSDAEFKTLVIRMLTELVEYSHKLDEKNEGYAK